MKKTILLTITSLIFCIIIVAAQDRLSIFKNDKSLSSILISKISNLTFSDNESILNVNKTDNTTEQNNVANIDSITFSNDAISDDAVRIIYSESSVYVSNPQSNNGVIVSVNNQDVIINSTSSSKDLQYAISGTSTNGSLKIYSSYRYELILNGINITNSIGAAINNQCNKKTTVTLVDGTINTLTDGSAYQPITGEDMKGTFFSEGALVFQGNGSLSVQGNYSHAISSDDYIKVTGGNITVTGSVKDGIHCDYYEQSGGTIKITATGDGIEAEEGYVYITDGNLTINSGDDAITSSYKTVDNITPYVQIDGGNITIVTTNQKGTGIKSKISNITINGGTFDITVNGIASKALSSGGNMAINNGNITLKTTGGGYFDTDEQDVSAASGIKCDSNLTIKDGTLSITSSGAGGKGISVDGIITFNGGNTTVTTTGVQYKYGSYDTAAKAIKSDGNLIVNNGHIIISTSKTEAEGLESKDSLFINGGTIEIEAYDDGINATNHIQINGGTIYVYSQTNDGIDSNGTLTVTGGLIVSSGAASPEEGFDCDNNTFKITGGILIGTGGATSNPTSSVSTQRSVVYGAGSVTSGQYVQIKSSKGDVIIYKIPRTYSSMTMLFSCPDLVSGTTYTINKGGSVSGGTNFHGYYTNTTYSGGTTAYTFNPTSIVTNVGSTSGGGGRP